MRVKKVNPFWQIVRALCIISVIAIHCPNAIGLELSSPQFQLYVVMRSFVNFPVAVFLFLSGYFVNQEKCLKDTKNYLINRGGVRLLIPYMVWSMLYIIISVLSGDGLSAKTIIFRLFTGNAAGPLYYIVVLIQLTFMTPLLIHTLNKKHNWLWLITPVALIAVYCFAFMGKDIPWYCDTLFPLWFGFYYLGLKVKAGDAHDDRFLKKIGSIPYLLLAFVLNLVESEMLLHKHITPALSLSQNRFFGFIYALVIIGVLYKLSERTSVYNKALVWLGDNSYAVYFTHYLIIKIIGKVIGNTFKDCWILNFVVTFVSTLFLTCAVIVAIKLIAKKIGKQNLLKYIGY